MADMGDTLRSTTPPMDDLDMVEIRRRAEKVAQADQRRQRRTFAVVATALVVAIAVMVPVLGRGGAPVTVAAGSQLPDVTGPSAAGQGEVVLTDFAGQPLLVHVWAPWCGPCTDTWLPDLAAYAADEDPVAVVTAAIITDRSVVAEALAAAGLDAPTMVLDDNGPLRSLLPDDLEQHVPLNGVPMILAFNAEGTLVQARVGAPPQDAPYSGWLDEMGELARTATAYTPFEQPVGPQATFDPSPGPSVTGMPTAAPNVPGCDRPDPPAGSRIYEVQTGDTLSSIAEAVYGDPTAFGVIADANDLDGGRPLCVGEMLVIPSDSADGPGLYGSLPVDDDGNRLYEVQPGDTLAIIAATVYGDPTQAGLVGAANGVTSSSPLQVGARLVIPHVPFTDIERDGATGDNAALPSAGPVPDRLRQAIIDTAPAGWAEAPGPPESIVLRGREDDIRFEIVEPPQSLDPPAWIARDISEGAVRVNFSSDGVDAAVRGNVQAGGWRMHVALPDTDYLLQLTPLAPDPDFDDRIGELADWIIRVRAELA